MTEGCPRHFGQSVRPVAEVRLSRKSKLKTDHIYRGFNRLTQKTFIGNVSIGTTNENLNFDVRFLYCCSHAQGLAALQAYCHWMAQYYLETHRQQQHQEKFVKLISNAVDALIPLLNKEVSLICMTKFVCDVCQWIITR